MLVCPSLRTIYYLIYSAFCNFICLKPKQKRLFLKLLPYPVISLISGLMYYIIERGLMGDANFYPSTKNPYDPISSFLAIFPMSIVLGLLIGIIEESTLFSTKLKRLSFFIKIILKTFIYVVLVLVLLLIVSFTINSFNMGLPLFHEQVLDTILNFFTSFTLLSIVIFIGFMISITLFYSEIVDYLGVDVVSSFFTGKYARSVEEDRIFMFLDMKGSTTIAEKLGHQKHYKLINDYYADMSNSIIRTKGHIYQYVGDEVVIFWNLEEGITANHCLECFFQIKGKIQHRSDYYLHAYGVIPTFKAGVHFGKVTRGQVGVIKRELLFTGDVLNTTSRIQSLCNELQSDLLISEELKDRLIVEGFQFERKGSFELKGRNQPIILYEANK